MYTKIIQNLHCVKRVRIRNYFGPYSVRKRENTDQNNSEYGYFSRSVVLGEILETCVEPHNKIDRYVVSFVNNNKKKINGHLPKGKSGKYIKTKFLLTM